MNLYRHLITENPMLIEIRRFGRKILGVGPGNALNAVVFALMVVCYLGLLAVVWNFRTSVPPIVVIMIQTFLITLMAPSLLHAAIAGERERRSWDLLIAAPITHAQIVAGKFLGAAAAIGCTVALFILPTAIAWIFFEEPYSNYQPMKGAMLMDILQAEVLSLSFGLLICALSLLFSARVKRGFMALGAVLGILLIGLLIIPILVESTFGWDPFTTDLMFFLHPFYALAKMVAPDSMGSDLSVVGSAFWGVPQTFVYLFLTVVLLVWTERTIRFADGEAKFLPRRQHA